MAQTTNAIATLKRAFAEQRLTLFLGAGVSVANGLPTWEKLVLSLYFATISEQKMNGWRPYANYLYAISEWYLKRSIEPLEITARKVRSFYKGSSAGENAFLMAIHEALYGVNTKMNPTTLLRANPTLNAVVDLCAATHAQRFGVSSVISYNYDSLLEMTLAPRRPSKAVYSKQSRFGDQLPIFHVHGFVPAKQNKIDRRNAAIIFTEAQYNVVASDPYSWSNVVQLREMSSNVGLMIGLSLSDRNIRRLLDALGQSPLKPRIFALLKSPEKVRVKDSDADQIHKRAIKILEQFQKSGTEDASGVKSAREGAGFQRTAAPSSGLTPKVKSARTVGVKSAHNVGVKSARNAGINARKSGLVYQQEIRGIIEQVDLLEQQQQESVLEQLGIVPIWYDDHAKIPGLLARIHER